MRLDEITEDTSLEQSLRKIHGAMCDKVKEAQGWARAYYQVIQREDDPEAKRALQLKAQKYSDVAVTYLIRLVDIRTNF